MRERKSASGRVKERERKKKEFFEKSKKGSKINRDTGRKEVRKKKGKRKVESVVT